MFNKFLHLWQLFKFLYKKQFYFKIRNIISFINFIPNSPQFWETAREVTVTENLTKIRIFCFRSNNKNTIKCQSVLRRNSQPSRQRHNFQILFSGLQFFFPVIYFFFFLEKIQIDESMIKRQTSLLNRMKYCLQLTERSYETFFYRFAITPVKKIFITLFPLQLLTL